MNTPSEHCSPIDLSEPGNGEQDETIEPSLSASSEADRVAAILGLPSQEDIKGFIKIIDEHRTRYNRTKADIAKEIAMAMEDGKPGITLPKLYNLFANIGSKKFMELLRNVTDELKSMGIVLKLPPNNSHSYWIRLEKAPSSNFDRPTSENPDFRDRGK